MATNLSQALLEGSGIVPSLIQELAAGGFEGRDSFHDYIYTKFILGDDRSNSSGVANPGLSVFASSNNNCPDPEQVLGHGAEDPGHAGVPSIINCRSANEAEEMSGGASLIKPVAGLKPDGSKKKLLQLPHSAAQQVSLGSSEIQRKMKKKNPYKKKEKTFVCEVCGRGFAEKYTMNRHMFTHTRIKPFSCSKCKMSFARSDGLAKHIAAGHRRVDSHHCDVCGGTFSSELSFEQHRREYGNTLPFVCNLCMLAFSQCCHLNYHMKSHPLSKLNEGFDYEGENDKNIDMSELVPDDCNSPKREQDDFAVKELLSKLSKSENREAINRHYGMDVFNPHIVIKPEIEEFPTCNTANSRMFTDSSINSSDKGNNPSDSLNIISLSTSASRVLLNSLADQEGSSSDMPGTSNTLKKCAADKENPVSDSEMKKYYDIKIPNPKYRDSSSLKGIGVGEDGLFKCDRCGKGFSRKYHMQRHVKLHIRGPVPRAHLLDWTRRPYACGVCKMGFTRQHHLTRHILIHTGERPHSCHVCDKAFRRFTNLTLHIRTVHGAERPFKCHICGRGFPRLYSLQRHQKLHMKNALAASSSESGSQLYDGFKAVGTASVEREISPADLSANPTSANQSSGSSQTSADSSGDAVADKYRRKINAQSDRVGSSELAGTGSALNNQEKYILLQDKIHDASFQNDQHIQNKDQNCHPGETDSRSNQSGLQQQQVSSPPGMDNKGQKIRLASPHTDNMKLQNAVLSSMSNFTSSPDHGEVIRSHVSFGSVPDFSHQQQQQQTLQNINEDRLMPSGAMSNQNLRMINMPVGHEMSIRDAVSYAQSHRSGSSDFTVHQQQIQSSLSMLNMLERPGSRNTIGQVNLPEAYHHPSASYNQTASSIQMQPGSAMNLPVSCSTMLPGNLQELASYSYSNHVDIGTNHGNVNEPIVYSHNHSATSMPFHAGIHSNYQHHMSDSLDQDLHSHPTPVNSHNNMQY